MRRRLFVSITLIVAVAIVALNMIQTMALSASMENSMKAMEVSIRKINTTGDELNTLSNNIESSVEDIGGQVDKFKV